jgi:hypothetical protein
MELLRGIDQSYKIGESRCRRLCKVFDPNRTKMFHVKHFGTIDAAGNEPRLVGFREGPKEGTRRRKEVRSIQTISLSIGVLVFAASLNPPRAQDSYVPAENAEPLGHARGGVRSPVKTDGDLHLNANGKPCLEYFASARPHLIDKSLFDYVVAVTNKCPASIKIQICQKDRSGCSGAVVLAYRSKEFAMGFGPGTNFFEYIAKEAP